MNYIYSTLTSSQKIPRYKDGGSKEIGVIEKFVLIKGGANLAHGNSLNGGLGLMTPKGVVTEVSDEDLEFLEANGSFKRWVERGFIRVEKREKSLESMVKTMTQKDQSAPKTPDDPEFVSQKRSNSR
jgi:hypothetical protein